MKIRSSVEQNHHDNPTRTTLSPAVDVCATSQLTVAMAPPVPEINLDPSTPHLAILSPFTGGIAGNTRARVGGGGAQYVVNSML
jgi:hypothetical protein